MQREQLGFVVPASERPLIDATAAQAEPELDQAELAAAREQGRALTLDEAVAPRRAATDGAARSTEPLLSGY